MTRRQKSAAPDTTRYNEVGRREFLRAAGLGALALGLPLGGCSSKQPADPVDGGGNGEGGAAGLDPFTVAVLPDTQIYADSYPETYVAQTRWIVENRDKERIAFVTHVGDVVDNGPSIRQWANARQAMALLDEADLPYGICLGNHDVQYSDAEYQYPPAVDHTCTSFADFDCKAEHFLDNFGPQRYGDRPWFGGASPSGLSSYQTIASPGGLSLLFLHIALDFPADEVAWAQTVVDQHPEAAIHVTTHRYMYDFRLVSGLPYPLSTLLGGRSPDLVYLVDDPLYYNDSITANEFFSRFVSKNTNIFMVECGHVDGEYRQVSENAAGLPVHEIMVDFQTFAHRSEGWMRLLRFDPEAATVQVSTFSPTLDRYRDNGEGFDASVNALQSGFNLFAEKYSALIDVEALQQKLEYWVNDPGGRDEYYDLLYGGGHRDSSFSLPLDLAAYPASRAAR